MESTWFSVRVGKLECVLLVELQPLRQPILVAFSPWPFAFVSASSEIETDVLVPMEGLVSFY